MISPELKDFIRRHADDDVRKVALLKNDFSKEQFLFALQQIEGRRIAKQKVPSWAAVDELLYPVHLSLEQCSSEVTARYKASLIGGGATFADLTGGMGVDFSFTAKDFEKSVYVERNAALCELARHNFPLLELSGAEVHNCSSQEFINQAIDEHRRFDSIYMDPARRDGEGRKVVSICDCEPNLIELKEHLFSLSDSLWVKYSPMLDITLALNELSNVDQVHVVSVQNECKELLLHLTPNASSEPIVTCVNFKKNGQSDIFRFNYMDERNLQREIASSVGAFLYEPNASIMKAGAFRSLSSDLNVGQLDLSSHLYTSDDYLENFPGRRFRVDKVFTMNKKELSEGLKHCDSANITVRNFPMSAENLRKKLKIKDGGEIYIFATSMQNQNILIKCLIV